MMPSQRHAGLTEQQMHRRFWLAAAGSLLAAAAVALSAYSAHAAGLDADARGKLFNACILALVHGIAVSALAPLAVRRLPMLGLLAIFVGTLLFSGSVIAARLAGGSSALAPFGGMLMIAGWVLHAAGQWRR